MEQEHQDGAWAIHLLQGAIPPAAVAVDKMTGTIVPLRICLKCQGFISRCSVCGEFPTNEDGCAHCNPEKCGPCIVGELMDILKEEDVFQSKRTKKRGP